MTVTRWRLAVLAAGWGIVQAWLPAHRARAECVLGAVAVLPLEKAQGHFAFTAQINGKPANLVLDTGNFATALSLTAAQRLGVRLAGTDSQVGGVGGYQQLYRGVATHMRVGNLSADGMMLAGINVFNNSRLGGLDGLMGMNMMAAYDIDLDFAGQHAVLYEADGDCHKPTVALSPPLYAVPLEYIEHDRVAEIDISVDGHRMRAIIDSGASGTVMFRSAAQRLGLDLSPLYAPGHGISGGIGPLAVASMSHIFRTVTIGGLTIHNMPVQIIEQSNKNTAHIQTGSLLADPASGEGGGEDMLLGADFMEKVHLWISHSSHRLIMQYPPLPSVLPH